MGDWGAEVNNKDLGMCGMFAYDISILGGRLLIYSQLISLLPKMEINLLM